LTSGWKITGVPSMIGWSEPGGTIGDSSAGARTAAAGFISPSAPIALATEDASAYPHLPENWYEVATIL